MNTLVPGVVKFTYNYSEQRIEFLDLEISIVDGKLETDLFIKPTNLQLYLHYFSNHPEHCKAGIVYSQALRIIERCSLEENKTKHLENLKTKLKDMKYPDSLIVKQFSRAEKKDRKSLIFQQREPKKKSDDKIRLIFTHNAKNPPVHMWLRQAKRLLNRNDKAKKMCDSIQVTSRQPRNLQRIVAGNSKVLGGNTPPSNPGCFKCQKKCKVSCPILQEGQKFQSTNTQKVYTIKKRLHCDISFVIS